VVVSSKVCSDSGYASTLIPINDMYPSSIFVRKASCALLPVICSWPLEGCTARASSVCDPWDYHTRDRMKVCLPPSVSVVKSWLSTYCVRGIHIISDSSSDTRASGPFLLASTYFYSQRPISNSHRKTATHIEANHILHASRTLPLGIDASR
jgi:hypothetical protein